MWLQLSKSSTLALTMVHLVIEKATDQFPTFTQLNFKNPFFADSNGDKEIRISGVLADGSTFTAKCDLKKLAGIWNPEYSFVEIWSPSGWCRVGAHFKYVNVGGQRKLVATFRPNATEKALSRYEKLEQTLQFYLRRMVEDPIDGTDLDCATIEALRDLQKKFAKDDPVDNDPTLAIPDGKSEIHRQ